MTAQGEQTGDGRLRLVALLVPLSLVTDLGMGHPDEHAARACLLATRLGERMGLAPPELADVYYATLLAHLGCTATAALEATHLGGDELATRPLVSRTDFTRGVELRQLLTSIGAGRGPLGRMRMIAGLLLSSRWAGEVERSVCEVASLVAARLELPAGVRDALAQGFERWDGKQAPRGLRGEQIAVAARFSQLASRAIAFHELGGVEAALEAVRVSSGSWFDPAIAACFEQHGPTLIAEIEASDALEAAIAAEPRPWRWVRDGDGLARVARAFADMVDLKSTFTLGHSPGVQRLAEPAAAALGLDAAAIARLGIAALLHDLGRVAVPAGTWERRGTLSAADRERIRLHPYYSERVLARAPALADVATLAGLHHERLDGSGYHRGAHARELPLAARLLAAADAYHTQTEPRPHRAALAADEAAELIAAQAQAGRLDPDAVGAVLDAAGTPRPRVVAAPPAGLTERECDALRLLATGCSNREIAERLVISRRTAEHHVQHIYEKLGVSTRAAAIMFALQHDMVSQLDG